MARHFFKNFKTNNIPKIKVKNLTTNDIKIKRSIHEKDKDKSEAQITKDHESYCKEHKILYFHTKVKGEPHMCKGRVFMKKAENSGFFDMILVFKNSVVLFLELKAGKGGKWEEHQIEQYDKVIAHGGYALCSNSIRDTHNFLKEKGLIYE